MELDPGSASMEERESSCWPGSHSEFTSATQLLFKDSVSLAINGNKSTSPIVDSSRDFRLVKEKCRTMRGSYKQTFWGGTWT